MATVGSDVSELKLHSCIGFTGESDTWFPAWVAALIRPHLFLPSNYRTVPPTRVVGGHMIVWLPVWILFPVVLLLLLVYGRT